MGFRVLWSPTSWLPDLNREHGLLQAPRASVLLPQAGRAGPQTQQFSSTHLPMHQLQLPEVPGQLSPCVQPSPRGGGSWGTPSTSAAPQGREVALRSWKSS